ncbi:MAG: DUF4326 domain-containing protein [Chloroflexi bacterium]|nr:DUF4326 domain-containing protein [Chloroflexota bacterium]
MNVNITVAKHGTVRKEPAYTVYVGRTRRVGKQYHYALHELANLYYVGEHGTRDEVVEKYRCWLWNEIQSDRGPTRVTMALGWLLEHHNMHGKLTLVCHCAPAACHCDVIKACLEWLTSKEEIDA